MENKTFIVFYAHCCLAIERKLTLKWYRRLVIHLIREHVYSILCSYVSHGRVTNYHWMMIKYEHFHKKVIDSANQPD